MIPYKDDNPTETFPFCTILFIALNIGVYFMELYLGQEEMVYTFGVYASAILTFESPQPIHPSLTILTSMFMHGGLLHLGGNMLYLWIFGNNIEDRLGHVRFVFFYIAAGAVAAYAQALSNTVSLVPMIGASGAVAGVLGAYMVLFPRAQVYTIIFLGIIVQVVRLPALIVIGFWAIIQLVNGALASGMAAQGGVAWFAHIGGFVFGIAAIKFLLISKSSSYRRRIKWL